MPTCVCSFLYLLQGNMQKTPNKFCFSQTTYYICLHKCHAKDESDRFK